MSEERIIADAVALHAAGDVIPDLAARVIAAQWHGGQWTALYALASAGATVLYTRELTECSECGCAGYDARCTCDTYAPDPLGRIRDEIAGALAIAAGDDGAALRALRAYVESVGPRDRVPGWSDLHY